MKAKKKIRRRREKKNIRISQWNCNVKCSRFCVCSFYFIYESCHWIASLRASFAKIQYDMNVSTCHIFLPYTFIHSFSFHSNFSVSAGRKLVLILEQKKAWIGFNERSVHQFFGFLSQFTVKISISFCAVAEATSITASDYIPDAKKSHQHLQRMWCENRRHSPR